MQLQKQTLEYYDFMELLDEWCNRIGCEHQDLYHFHKFLGETDETEYKNLWHKLLKTLPDNFSNDSYITLRVDIVLDEREWYSKYIKMFYEIIKEISNEDDCIVVWVSW